MRPLAQRGRWDDHSGALGGWGHDVAEARGLRELGVPVAALEILERTVDDAAVQWNDQALRAIAAEAVAAARDFPEYADRAILLAERASAAASIPLELEPATESNGSPEDPDVRLDVPVHRVRRRARPKLALDSTPARQARRFRSPTVAARAAQVPLVALAAVELATIVLVSRELATIDAGRSGLLELTPAAARGDNLGRLGTASLVLTILAAVMFIGWLRRTVANLAPLGARSVPYGTWWAVGSWFVPILNLWRPMTVVDEVWRASDPNLPRDEGDSWTRLRASWVVIAWWTLFIGSWLVELVGLRLRSTAESLDDLARADNLLLGAACASLIAIPLAIAVIHEITQRQEMRAAAVL